MLTMLTVFSLKDANSSRKVTQTPRRSIASIFAMTFLLRNTASCRVVEEKISFMMTMLLGVAWARIARLEDKDLVAEVDLHTCKVIARWPVAPGGHPVGMALDKESHRLFIGCRNPQKLVIMSAVDGKVLGSVDIGMGVDATRVDGHQAFASCRDGKLIVATEKAGQYVVEQTVTPPTAPAPWISIPPPTSSTFPRRSSNRPQPDGGAPR